MATEKRTIVEPTAKYDNGVMTVRLPVDAAAGSISKSEKSFVLGGTTIRDVQVGNEMVRVSISVYIPLKQPKKASEKAAKVTMTLAEARKAAARKAREADGDDGDDD